MNTNNVKPQNAVLSINTMFFSDIEYKYHPELQNNSDYMFNFERSVSINQSSHLHPVTLTCNLSDENGATEIHITMVTVFECIETNEEILKSLLGINGIAIMFPYLRSQLTLLTSQPGRTPIIMNSMNIVKMFEEAEDTKLPE